MASIRRYAAAADGEQACLRLTSAPQTPMLHGKPLPSTWPMSTDSLTAEFPLRPDLVYLNHAAVSPWPRRSGEAVQRFAAENVRQGAYEYPRWERLETHLREQCRALINAPSAGDIALLKNTSEGLSLVAHGLSWQAGDNIVSCRGEFPSNRIVWESLGARGVELRAVDVDSSTDPEAALLAACDSRTRLLAVSSVQYARGLRLHPERLGEHCRARGILFCVDAIQSIGALKTDVQAWQADFVVADGHKWMLGPEGLALYYCRGELRPLLTLHEYGWHMVERPGDFDRETWQPDPSARRFECGSPNMLGAHALSASLSLLLEVGAEQVQARVLERSTALMRGVRARAALRLLTPTAPGRFAGIVTFRPRSGSLDRLFARLRQGGVVCAKRGGGIRFSPHFYTPLEQLEIALGQVDRALRENGG
jgi:cysteine desulfurase/selenocysteine lyase